MTDPTTDNPPPPPQDAPDLSPEEARRRLVQQLRTQGALHDAQVERALNAVPRHLFLPDAPLAASYADIAVPTHWEHGVAVSSASQPAIVALMLEQLRLAPGLRVLEIGAGTGYNAALLAELVGPSGAVTSMDIDPEIVDEARAHLAAAGYGRVQVVAGDGSLGWLAGAPYDRIILTVGANDISPAWFEQLVDGGVLVLPLVLGGPEASIAFRRRGERFESESLTPCGFMRLRGAQASGRVIPLAEGWRLGGERAEELAEPIARLLATRPRRRLWMRPPPAFAQHLGLRGVSLVMLWRDKDMGVSTPYPKRRPRWRYGLYVEGAGEPSLALFSTMLPMLLIFGAPAAEQVLEAEARQWQPDRYPPLETWRVVAQRADHPTAPAPPGVTRIVQRRFIFDIYFDEASALAGE